MNGEAGDWLGSCFDSDSLASTCNIHRYARASVRIYVDASTAASTSALGSKDNPNLVAAVTESDWLLEATQNRLCIQFPRRKWRQSFGHRS